MQTELNSELPLETPGRREVLPRRALVRFAVGITVMLGLVGLLHLYLARTLLLQPQWAGWIQMLGFAALGTGYLLFPVGFWASRQGRSPLLRGLVLAGFIWMGTFELLVGIVAPLDVLFLVFEWLRGTAGSPEVWVERARLEALLGLGFTVPAVLWGLKTARGTPKVERVRVPVKDLPDGLVGLRIAQISDLHVGDTLDDRWLSRVVAQVNALGADLIAVTGDLIDGTVDEVGNQVAPLGGLRAPLGVYYVTGNHEYYHGGPAWSAEVARLGLAVLHNAHRVVTHQGASFVVAGVPDLEGGHFHDSHACRPALAFVGAPEGVPRLLLAHQPRVAKLASGLGVSLQLSGHTHGGQMWPFMLFVRLQQPVVSGLAKVAGVWVYTSRGTGYWGPPLRVGPTPEVTLLTLGRDESAESLGKVQTLGPTA